MDIASWWPLRLWLERFRPAPGGAATADAVARLEAALAYLRALEFGHRSDGPGDTTLGLALEHVADLLRNNPGLLGPATRALRRLTARNRPRDSSISAQETLKQAQLELNFHLDWLHRLRLQASTTSDAAAAETTPSAEGRKRPAFKPDEAALLSAVTEKFCQSWHYRCSLGVAAVAIIAALGGTVAIFGQSVAVWSRVDNVAQAAETRGKEAIAAITTSTGQLTSEIKQRQTEIATLDREMRDKLAAIERDAQARMDATLSAEGQARLRTILGSLETGLVEQRERETQALRSRIADLQAELSAAATKVAGLSGTVQAQSLAADAMRGQLDRARLLVGEVDGYLATGRSAADAASHAVRFADTAGAAARQAEAERVSAEAVRKGMDTLFASLRQDMLDLAKQATGVRMEIERLSAWTAHHSSLPADGDRVRTSVTALGHQSAELGERLQRVAATLAVLESQRLALMQRGETLAPRLAELETGLLANRDDSVRLAALMQDLARRAAEAEGTLPDTGRLAARSGEVERQLEQYRRQSATIAIELAAVVGEPEALRDGLKKLRTQLENMETALRFLSPPLIPRRPASPTTPPRQRGTRTAAVASGQR